MMPKCDILYRNILNQLILCRIIIGRIFRVAITLCRLDQCSRPSRNVCRCCYNLFRILDRNVAAKARARPAKFHGRAGAVRLPLVRLVPHSSFQLCDGRKQVQAFAGRIDRFD